MHAYIIVSTVFIFDTHSTFKHHLFLEVYSVVHVTLFWKQIVSCLSSIMHFWVCSSLMKTYIHKEIETTLWNVLTGISRRTKFKWLKKETNKEVIYRPIYQYNEHQLHSLFSGIVFHFRLRYVLNQYNQNSSCV